MEDYRTSKVLPPLLFLLVILQITSIAAENEGRKPSSPFEFIRHLQGCQKGEKGVKGLHQLKEYLKYFGYIDPLQNFKTNEQDVEDDDFDDVLESAIKTYQINYHLNVTGILDVNTVSTMTMPRCGLPDIMNGTNWMRNNTYQHNEDSTVILAESQYSFFPGNPKWPSSKFHLTYAFYQNTKPLAINAVRRAFKKWASTTHFSFSQIKDVENADIKIGFFRRNHNDGYAFFGRGGAMAHSFAPPDGRFHFDADELWSIGAHAGNMDVETVALHEIGHLLGLGHSSDEGAIMYPSLPPGEVKGLHANDIRGIKALYND